ncbi:MAG: asparagine synthase (glutamine-hydrolyzing) [Planctomycetota bacterium]
MCGLAGILRAFKPERLGEDAFAAPAPEERIPEAWLDALDGGIRHRGSDGEGRWRDRVITPSGVVADVAFIHRRMAIIDPTDGAQPMVSGGAAYKGRVAVVFNGCVYNAAPLRRALQSAGLRFETDHSDTEALLMGYRHWGPAVVTELNGMFAFAVWDARRNELTLARDRGGEKPLLIAPLPDGSGAAFASTASALVGLLNATEGDARPARTAGWIARGALGTSPISGISIVPAGMRLSWTVHGDGREGGVASRAKRYWLAPPRRPSGTALTPDRVDEMIARSVRRRLDADVPIGAFLSGGVDSSIICAHAAKAQKERGEPLLTFSVRMPDVRYDESPIAEAIAKDLGASHTTLEVRPKPADELPKLIEQIGLPLMDSSLLPTAWVSQAAHRHVKVALSGDGADELFGGYQRHVAARVLQTWGPVLRFLPTAFIPQRDPKGGATRLARLAAASKRHGYTDLLSVFPSQELRRLLGPSARLPLLRDDGRRARRDPLRFDFYRYMADDILLKVDSASMACPLEVRAPFLDPELIDACMAEPISSLMPAGARKGLLRMVARRYMTAELADRPKMGFAIPIGDWFRSDFGGMGALLMDTLNSSDPWPGLDVDIRKRALMRLLSEHMSASRDHSQRLYGLLVLSIWCRWLRARGPAHTGENGGANGSGNGGAGSAAA